MNTNYFAHEMIAKERQNELIKEADNERLVRRIIAWLKNELRDEHEATMHKPEITIYKN